MKVLLHFEKEKLLRQSGIGRALRHQKKALRSAGIEYTQSTTDSFDLVHTNTLFGKSFRMMRKFQKKGVPVIVHGHSTIEDFRNSFRAWKLMAPFFNRMILKMYRNADLIITPTPYSKNLIENYKGVRCPVVDVSNGIDLDEYTYSEEKINNFRQHFNLYDEKVVIGIGLFFDRKGIRDFFEIASQMPEIRFIWFGHLGKLLTTHKVNKAIKRRPKNVIMPGYIDGDIIKGALLDADAVLFPSYEETEGIVILEGLASKTPVIVRDIPVYFPWLKHDENVLMAKNNNEFINMINRAINKDMSALVENGYKVVQARTIELVGERFKEVYEKVLKAN